MCNVIVSLPLRTEYTTALFAPTGITQMIAFLDACPTSEDKMCRVCCWYLPGNTPWPTRSIQSRTTFNMVFGYCDWGSDILCFQSDSLCQGCMLYWDIRSLLHVSFFASILRLGDDRWPHLLHEEAQQYRHVCSTRYSCCQSWACTLLLL